MMYFKEELLTKEIAVHLETEEQANALCKWLHFKNEKWNTGVSYLEETYWKVYKDNTCYRIYGGAYGDLDYYKEANTPVISFAEAIDLTKSQIIEPPLKALLKSEHQDDYHEDFLYSIDTRRDRNFQGILNWFDYCSLIVPAKKEEPKSVEMSHVDIFKAIREGAVIKDPNTDIYNHWCNNCTIDEYQICYNYTGTDKDEWLQMKERK